MLFCKKFSLKAWTGRELTQTKTRTAFFIDAESQVKTTSSEEAIVSSGLLVFHVDNSLTTAVTC
jgi:hypothetical protein